MTALGRRSRARRARGRRGATARGRRSRPPGPRALPAGQGGRSPGAQAAGCRDRPRVPAGRLPGPRCRAGRRCYRDLGYRDLGHRVGHRAQRPQPVRGRQRLRAGQDDLAVAVFEVVLRRLARRVLAHVAVGVVVGLRDGDDPVPVGVRGARGEPDREALGEHRARQLGDDRPAFVGVLPGP